VAKPNDLCRDGLAVTRRQNQAVTHRCKRGEPVDIDHQARQTADPAFGNRGGEFLQQGPAHRGAFEEARQSH
jgi:hypothetical protein